MLQSSPKKRAGEGGKNARSRGFPMKLRSSLKGRKEAGQSAVELAMVLPALVILALGTYDVSLAIRAKNQMVNVSREGANQTKRGPRTSAELQLVMTSLAATARPLQLERDGMMYVTEVSRRDGVRFVKRIPWDRNGADPCGDMVEKFPPSRLAETIAVDNNTQVCIFEVIYNHKSMLLHSFAPQLHATTVF